MYLMAIESKLRLNISNGDSRWHIRNRERTAYLAKKEICHATAPEGVAFLAPKLRQADLLT